MTLNQKLVVLRKKAGITQGELAASLEVSRQSVHKWESGQCYPEVTKLIRLKEIFKISIDDLLDDGVEIALPEKKRAKKISTDTSVESENRKPLAITDEIETPEQVIEEIKVEIMESSDIQEAKEEKVASVEEKKKGFFGRIFGRR